MSQVVHIILVTYNGSKWIDRCLDSIKASSVEIKTWIIDNDSSDDTLAKVATHPLDAEVQRMNDNLGFGRANNLGISLAMKAGAQYIMLLNQDAYLYPETLERLLHSASEAGQPYGILSPIHLDGKGEELDYNFGKYYANFMANKDLITDALKQELKSVYMLPFVNAAAWFIPRATLEQIGGFDPLFSHYGEDDNYCQRLCFHGLSIGLLTESFVRHDREGREMARPKEFSEEGLHLFRRKLKIKYADPSNDSFPVAYDQEISDLKKWSNRNRVKLNPEMATGYKAKAKIMMDEREAIAISRSRTSSLGAHFLDL